MLPGVLLVTARADVGGGPRHIELLLQAWAGAMEVHVACPREEPYWTRFEALMGRPCVEIPHRRFTLPALARLWRYVNDCGIGLIHAHGKGAGTYGRALRAVTGVPCVLTPHGLHIPGGMAKRMLYLGYEHVTERWLNGIVHVSEAERTAAISAGLWRRTPSRTVENGTVSISDGERQLLRESGHRHVRHVPRPVVTCATRAVRQKNLEAIRDIALLCPNAGFLVLGSGATEARQYLGTEELPSNMHFVGTQADVSAWLAASDLYLSAARWEGMPFAVLEAMALALPVVASDIPPHRELILDGETGELFSLDDPGAAVRRIRRLLQDPSAQARYGEAARARQRSRFTAKRMAQGVRAVYAEVLGEDD